MCSSPRLCSKYFSLTNPQHSFMSCIILLVCLTFNPLYFIQSFTKAVHIFLWFTMLSSSYLLSFYLTNLLRLSGCTDLSLHTIHTIVLLPYFKIGRGRSSTCARALIGLATLLPWATFLQHSDSSITNLKYLKSLIHFSVTFHSQWSIISILLHLPLIWIQF